MDRKAGSPSSRSTWSLSTRSRPGAHIVYKGARNCDTPLFDADYDVIDTGEADIITNSWSEGGEFSSANEDLVNNASYLQAAAEGITVLFQLGR